MELFQLTLLGGVTMGLIYAIAGASQVVIYRTSGYVSFAHGDIAAVSLYVGLFAHSVGMPYVGVAVLVVVVGAILGGLIGTLVVIPIERFGLLPAVMATVAVALVIQGVLNVVVGGQPRSFPSPGEKVLFSVGNVEIDTWTFASLVTCITVFAALGLLFAKTKMGVAMRAVHDSPDAAQILGIRSNRLRRLSWILSGGLAGVAGLFVAPTFSLTPHSVNAFLVFAFCAVVVGGFESIVGALVAGVGIGIAGNLVVAYMNPNLVNMMVYLVLLSVLLVRPYGIFGMRPVARV
jgi:branched-chain amino acid transport system permease protein